MFAAFGIGPSGSEIVALGAAGCAGVCAYATAMHDAKMSAETTDDVTFMATSYTKRRAFAKVGRDAGIRTRDLLHPNQCTTVDGFGRIGFLWGFPVVARSDEVVDRPSDPANTSLCVTGA